MHELAENFPIECIKFERGFRTFFELKREG